ncbi:expressed unknown protein [Seminavis robusta]|uniref:Spondin-like TSP1 domain-containing protein n=1 Tax=Seminavis robusta TaxID=568900 RepID=A0A9N8HES2_9STRA|nr:expressed unknown protein [Seminavis robusta]|eukprot:Sro529_g161030.1 n/a (1059) ;mRNA; r:28739-32494
MLKGKNPLFGSSSSRSLLFGSFLLFSLWVSQVSSQGCTNTCPPINFGTPVPSLCEGDLATEASTTSIIDKEYTVCHPASSKFRFRDFLGTGKVTVLSNFYIGCNAGRRESGVFAHTAQKYYDRYGNRTTFITSLKGGTTCNQWAGLYQADALELFPDGTVTPKEMPLTVLDQEYEIRDDWFTTPFGHPSYVILDGDLRVRHKFIGPCCGYEDYFDCTADVAVALDETLSGYIDAILMETGTNLVTDDAVNNVNNNNPQEETTPPQTATTPCTATEFSEWSDCSVTCGTGMEFRWRTVTPTTSGTLEDCPAPVETRPCVGPVAEPCPAEGSCIQEFGETWQVKTVASGFDGARDVAFHPTPGLHLGHYSEGRSFHPDQGEEAWVLNAHNHSVSIVTSLGTPVQSTISRRDRGYYHYMINATAFAFNMVSNSTRARDRDSFNYFAVCNANANTYLGSKEPNYFMGPTLYNTDPNNRNTVNRLGEPCGPEEPCFFLHADMLHEAPDCIGIAHDPEIRSAFGNVYWAFDNTGNNARAQLVRFDFQQPHGPGSMDHSVASIRRFPELEFARGPEGVHAGMVVHPARRELFVSVPSENRIIVVSVDSGSYARTAREEYPIYSNRLPSFEYNIFECVDHRELASGIQTPTGLALGPDGDLLFVAERDTGKILVLEVETGATLAEIATGFTSIGGLSFSPATNILHFVDEHTNTLNSVHPLSACANPEASRSSESFQTELGRAGQAVDEVANTNGFFAVYRNYECTVDPIIPAAVFFDQVHDDTGYASDNPDVQSMAGMDETAALLANRTDCGPTSELNFDALLLGGYYCHQCLPINDGSECDAGGVCTNVQWLGYFCSNEFYISNNGGTEPIAVTDGNRTKLETGQFPLRRGVTYRFTVQLGDQSVCLHDQPSSSSPPIAYDGNTGGCVTRGPLILNADNLPPELYLFASSSPDQPILELVQEGYVATNGATEEPDATDEPDDELDGAAGTAEVSPDDDEITIFTTAPGEPKQLSSESPNTGVVVGATLGCTAFLVILAAVGFFIIQQKAGKRGDLGEAPTASMQ